MKLAAVTLLVAMAGCSGALRAPFGVAAGNVRALPSHPGSGTNTPIRHIVIIVQENRTIDNLFQGFPGADTRAWGYTSTGRRVRLQQVSLNSPDIDNSYHASLRAFDGGKMDGFDLNQNYGGLPARYPYSYVDRRDVAPYWSMAEQYVLADHMFPTMHGQSYTGHIDLIAGTTDVSRSRAAVDFPSASPWDCEAPAGTTTPTIDDKGDYSYDGPYPCFTQFRTMADTLDAAGVSWRYYGPQIGQDWIAGAWQPFSSIRDVYRGPDWKEHVISPPPAILTDVAAGELASVTWVAPDWAYSDHAGSGTTLGPAWVSAVVNAIGESRFWSSTAIVLTWDDWGGWYDHVPPPQLDFRGLGIRVPCVILSPYAPRGKVDHTQYEFGSILRLVEDVFGLPQLGEAAEGYSDARATSLIDAFDFSQRARPFHRIQAPPFPYR